MSHGSLAKMAKRFSFLVAKEWHGTRIDQAISGNVAEVSRTRARRILSVGGVFVDGHRTKVASRAVWLGQRVDLHLLADEVMSAAHQQMQYQVPIVENCVSYVVVDKPSGMFCTPTPETDQHDLVAFLTKRLSLNNEQRLHLVHRLDRPTSGLLVLARNRHAAAELSQQVKLRQAQRHYLALLVGQLASEVSCQAPVDGKTAETLFVPIASCGPVTLVRAELGSGRTHQIRVHATALGMPVAGDSKYGRSIQRRLPSRPPRLALHATSLKFLHPETKQPVAYTSPLPPPLEDWMNQLGGTTTQLSEEPTVPQSCGSSPCAPTEEGATKEACSGAKTRA